MGNAEKQVTARGNITIPFIAFEDGTVAVNGVSAPLPVPVVAKLLGSAQTKCIETMEEQANEMAKRAAEQGVDVSLGKAKIEVPADATALGNRLRSNGIGRG